MVFVTVDPNRTAPANSITAPIAKAVDTLIAPVPTAVPKELATSFAPSAAERQKATRPPRASRKEGVSRAAVGVRRVDGRELRGGGRGKGGARKDDREIEDVKKGRVERDADTRGRERAGAGSRKVGNVRIMDCRSRDDRDDGDDGDGGDGGDGIKDSRWVLMKD